MSGALRVVLLERPDGTGPGRDLFTRLLAMRQAGYQRRHGEVAVAVDPYDRISTHVLVCREDADGLAPLMAFRTTTAGACAAAGLPFPLTAFLARRETAEHARVVAAELEACRRAGREASYGGLWTVDPALRADRRLFRDVWRLNGMLLVGLVRDLGVGQLLAGAIPSQGTDRLLGRYGMRLMEGADGVLPRIAVPHIPGETAVLMRMEEFSDEVLADAEWGRAAWENRLVIREPQWDAWRRRADLGERRAA